MQSLATIGYEMIRPYPIANLITTTLTATRTRTTLVALSGDESPGLKRDKAKCYFSHFILLLN